MLCCADSNSIFVGRRNCGFFFAGGRGSNFGVRARGQSTHNVVVHVPVLWPEVVPQDNSILNRCCVLESDSLEESGTCYF